MRIKHKYLRNRHVYRTTWKRVYRKEHVLETFCPKDWQYLRFGSAEEQIKENLKWIDEQTRYIVNGSHRCPLDSVPSTHRRMLNRERKAQERAIMAKIRQGDYELEFPKFKQDAAWDYW